MGGGVNHDSEVDFFFLAMLMHELGHAMLKWWTDSQINTPPVGEFRFRRNGGAGEFIEKKFFGGTSQPVGKIGSTAKFHGVGLSTRGGWRIVGMCRTR